MPPQKRKRFNAFEDFSAEPSTEPTGPLPVGQVATQPAGQIERIERLKPSQMLPDRFQPRRLLPSSIRNDFFNDRLDCYKAAAAWLELARNDPGTQGEIDRLLAMGNSFKEHGQIKPITGSWVAAANGEYVFQIETGERRFWAACLQNVSHKLKEEPLLRVEVVAHPTRQRQVLENRHAEPPSAVGQACEVSSLILAEMGIHPESGLEDEYDFFRRVHSQRMPAGLWDRIMPVMQLTRPRMVQLLKILNLPSPLLDVADRYRLPERVLREVLSQPKEQWKRLIHLSIQNQFTSDEVAEAAAVTPAPSDSKPSPRPTPQPGSPDLDARRALRRFVRALSEMEEADQVQTLDQMADDLMVSGKAEGTLLLLGELARLLEARLSRR
jgi:ParB-like chromosome segregation protein Spo0J